MEHSRAIGRPGLVILVVQILSIQVCLSVLTLSRSCSVEFEATCLAHYVLYRFLDQPWIKQKEWMWLGWTLCCHCSGLLGSKYWVTDLLTLTVSLIPGGGGSDFDHNHQNVTWFIPENSPPIRHYIQLVSESTGAISQRLSTTQQQMLNLFLGRVSMGNVCWCTHECIYTNESSMNFTARKDRMRFINTNKICNSLYFKVLIIQ